MDLKSLRANNPSYDGYTDKHFLELVAEESGIDFDELAIITGYAPSQPVAAEPSEPEESDLSGLAGSVWRGAKQTGRMIGSTVDTVSGNLPGVEEQSRKSMIAHEEDTPAAQRRLLDDLKNINRDQSVTGQIGDTLSAAGRNKMGTAQLITEQLPNTAVSLGAGYAGFKTGAATGAALGSVVPGAGTAAGAGIGGVLGFLGGMFLGNSLLEIGGKAMEKGQDGFTDEERSEAIKEGSIKSGVITGVDAATFGLGGKITKSLSGLAKRAGARAEAKVLMDAGVDMTSTATINAALRASPELLKTAKVAGERAALTSLSNSRKAGIAGTGLTLETVGEGAGEYLGELAATGDADVVDATIESIAGMSQSAVQTAYNYNKMSAQVTQEDVVKAAAQVNTEQTQQAVNNIASAQNVDEAINAASEAVKQKPVSSRDVWDSLQAKDQLLAEAERVGIDNPLQGDLNASSQEAQEASAEAGVLDQSEDQILESAFQSLTKDQFKNNPDIRKIAANRVAQAYKDGGFTAQDVNNEINDIYLNLKKSNESREVINDSLIGQDELSINDDDIPDSAFDEEDIDTIGRVGQFAGQLANTANISKLDEAKQLIKDGADPEQVRQSTGWHKGVDNKWRFEIDDSQARLKGRFQRFDSNSRVGGFFGSIKSKDEITLGKMVSHPKLFKAYPDLVSVPVTVQRGKGGTYHPGLDGKLGSISIGENESMHRVMTILMHEAQHAIQDIENFAWGSNVEFVKSQAKIKLQKAYDAAKDSLSRISRESDIVIDKAINGDQDAIDLIEEATKKHKDLVGSGKAGKWYVHAELASRDPVASQYIKSLADNKEAQDNPFDIYKRSAGEIEARNVEARLGMNADARKKVPPEATQDVPSSKAIVSFKKGEAERSTGVDYEKIKQRPGTTEKQREQGRLAFRDFVRHFNRRSKGRIVASSIPKDFREKSGSTLIGQKVASAGDLAAAAQVLRNPRFETFRVFYIKDNKVVHHSGVTSRMPGSVDVVIAKDGEKMSDAWKRYNKTIKDTMKRLGADGYYLLHNHPSGNADPSEADISFTKKVQEGAPGLIAHVVINSNEYGVLGGEHSLVPSVVKKNLTGGYSKDATIPHRALNARITKTEDIAEVGKLVQRKDGFFTAIALNAQLDVVSLAEIPMSVMSKSKMYQLGLLRSFARNSGGTSVAIVADKKNIHRFGEAVLEDVVLNVVTTEGESHPFSSGKQRLFETGRKKSIGVKETVQANQESEDSDNAHFNEIKAAVDELKSKWAQGPNVTVVKSVSDLSQFLDKKVTDNLPSDADGLYDPATDSAYVVADNILHPDRAKWVALHEVIGHGGLRKLDKSVNESIEFASKNKFVRDLSHSIARRRNESYNQRIHIQEAIAELAAASLNGGTQKLMFQYGIDVPVDAHKRMDSAINRIVEAIRRFLGKIFGTTTNQQIRDLITAMKIATEQGRANGASDDYIRKSLMIERAGYKTINNFVIPETEEYADNTTGDLGYFPGNSRLPAGPIRVEIGEATGNHRGFGLMHIVDNIRKDPKRLLVKRTKDTAEDTMRGVVATMRSVRDVYRDGNVLIFVNPKGKRAFVGEFKDGFYSIITERPHHEDSVKKFGKPLWTGRVHLPVTSQKGSDSSLPLPDNKRSNLSQRDLQTATSAPSGGRTGADSGNEQNNPNRPGPQAQRRKISISKSGNLIQQNSGDNQPLLSRATTLTDAGVNTEVEPQADDNVLPEETKTQAFRRRTQDAMLRFKVVQDWLKKNDIDLSEAANVYQRENISKGKMANKIDDFRRKELQPLIERIAKESKKAPKDGKFDLEDIVTYLEAVHIPEANAKMREIHKDKDVTANGITDEQAKKVQVDFEAMPNFQQFKKLAEEVRNIGTETLQMRLDAGLISQEQFDAYKKTYSHWVPLRGNMKPNGFGKGMSTVSKDKRRLGHALRDNEMILENIVQDREKAIMQVEKNKVGLSVAQFILEAKNDAIGTISKPEKMATIREFSYAVKFKGRTLASYQNKGAADAAVLRIMQGSSDIKVEGESLSNSDFKVERTYDPTIVMMAKPTLAENEIQVYVNGHAVRLQLNDPGLARAATNAGIEQVGAILQGARIFNRFLSKAYTAWSPDFLFMNMARDAYSGTLVLTGKKGAAFATKTMTNYAFAIKELFKSRNDPSQSQWVQRYRDAGGNIGAAYLDDLERVGESAVSALQEFAGARETYRMVYNEKIAEGASASKARTVAAMKAGIAKTKAAPVVGHLFKTLENVNAVIENSLRLATFKTAIESGESDQAAASLSKDLMNFNRKGEIANTAGALYLFYNPGMQGIHIVGEALTSSPHKAQVWGLLGGLTALSFMLSEIGRGLDEDEWENIPDHVKDRNMIFHIGDKQVTIPVAYGFGVFHAMGNLLSNYNHGEDPHEIAVKLASATFENFSVFGNPLIENGDTTDIRMDQVMPTIPKMIMGPGINMDSMGKQVTPIKYQESQPDSQNMTRTVRGTIYDDLASFLNDTTGGTKYTPGLIDISPNTIKYWVTNLTGGAGRFVSDIVTGSMDAAAGVAPELENVPVARKFVRNPGVTDARNGFWNSVKETETATERFRKAIKDGDVFRSQQMLDEKGDIIALAKFADKSKKMSARYRDAVQEIQNDDNMTRKEKKLRIKELEAAEQKVYESFLKIFREAKK